MLSAQADALLFDLGADATPTVPSGGGEPTYWNNVDAFLGSFEEGELAGLVTTTGDFSTISLVILSRFNGANENGTTAFADFPVTATQDSLFGNTELFGGLEDVTPRFKLTGLETTTAYHLTFYASRLGVSDNRETRYTVTGATTASADLNVANNVNQVVQVSEMAPDSAGEITIELSPGPNNDNANHFTYLGVLRLETATSDGPAYLIDFGAAGTPTEQQDPAPEVAWNNLTATIGTDPEGELSGLVTTNGTVTAMSLRITSRFNGANEAGTTEGTLFPTTATRDSLFGNTEAFGDLENVLPAFKLTGLDPNYLFRFTFYASRTGAADNRETRYTVTGANSAVADLNAANNVNEVVVVSDIQPDADGEISVALTPGPNNDNANHFTYLGVMQVDFSPVHTPRLLIDLGAAGTPTDWGTGDPDHHWNNVTADLGGTDDGELPGLLMTDGTVTEISFQMVSRFNGANENGITDGGPYPVSATRDSLFGNTELFGDLENLTPTFKLTGLNPETSYDLTFYASRLGVGDNRETHYAVTGATEGSADLDVANNETESVTVPDIKPTAAGEIQVALTPGINNDNGNHFVYLGVLQVDWEAATPVEPASLTDPSYADGSFSLRLNGSSGVTYQIQRSRTLSGWDDVQTVTLSGSSEVITIPQPESEYFYRAVGP